MHSFAKRIGFVSTGDRHRLVVVSFKRQLPLVTLPMLREYRHRYQLLLEEGYEGLGHEPCEREFPDLSSDDELETMEEEVEGC